MWGLLAEEEGIVPRWQDREDVSSARAVNFADHELTNRKEDFLSKSEKITTRFFFKISKSGMMSLDMLTSSTSSTEAYEFSKFFQFTIIRETYSANTT